MPVIKSVTAQQIFDSRGNPTIEVCVTSDDHRGFGLVPSGASTGQREALELRDKDQNQYLGKSVNLAIENVENKIAKILVNKNIESVRDVDNMLLELDASENKTNLGANSILGVSLASAHMLTSYKQKPLFQSLHDEFSTNNFIMPIPLVNVINGGSHADNNIDIQEFMIVPHGASSFNDAMHMTFNVFHTLKKILTKQKLVTSVGDEGGFAPSLDSNESALNLLCEAITLANYTPGKDISLALDVASSEFYSNNKYKLTADQSELNSKEMVDYLVKLTDKFPIVSIEDGLAEDDWDGWKLLTTKLGNKCQLVGDDLFVTNPRILQEGIDKKIANAILIKINQIGTISETFDAINLAQKNNYNTVISHRSGETEDATIADIAVSCGSGQIKTGSFCRSDRIAKYNQLLRIAKSRGLDYAKIFGN